MTSETRQLAVEASDTTLAVYVTGTTGSGNVMIALHGGPGQSHHYMRDLEQLAGHGFAVAFSCKTRGLCPSCNGKRMAYTAAQLGSGSYSVINHSATPEHYLWLDPAGSIERC